ncbi:MAG: mycothiol system anti-sigma-R factor [Nocardioides sp.]
MHEVPADTAARCADFLEGIVYLLDNELDDADVSAVRTHLGSCNPCFETYELQRRVKELVARSCAETAPEELRLKVTMLCREVTSQRSVAPE